MPWRGSWRVKLGGLAGIDEAKRHAFALFATGDYDREEEELAFRIQEAIESERIRNTKYKSVF
jgi:hypothetical protein